MCLEKKRCLENGVASEQVEARPTRARVSEGRAIREGNEGLTGDLRKLLKEFCLFCALISFFPPFFVEDGLVKSEEVGGYSPTCPLGGGVLKSVVKEVTTCPPNCQGKD